MSPMRPPAFTAAMPFISAWRVTSISFCAFSETLPTPTVRAASPKKPSTLQPARSRDAVDHFLVDGDAERGRIAAVAEERRLRARLLDRLEGDAVHVLRGHARLRVLLQPVQRLGEDRARAVHLLELRARLL